MPAHSFPSDVICKRRPVGVAGLWFRGNLAFGWFTDLLDYPFSGLAFCSFSRLALGLDLLRGGMPCSLGCGFATRGLSPGLFSKRGELCGPVVCLLDRSRTVGGIELCLLCGGLELRHLLPCRICLRTTLLRGAF